MVRPVFAIVFMSICCATPLPAAEDKPTGIQIDIGSIGTGNVGPAIAAARTYVARAINYGVADSFYVYMPRRGGPMPIEGGLSACVEKGVAGTQVRFQNLFKRLKNIRVLSGTTLHVTLVTQCAPIGTAPQVCGGLTGALCPAGQACVDDPTDKCDPKQGGADCSGTCQPDDTVCTADVQQCPDGSFVNRVPPSCAFSSCPSARK